MFRRACRMLHPVVKDLTNNMKVKHIIVCGHYGCKFTKIDSHDRLESAWLRNVNQLYETHRTELNRIDGSRSRNRRFAELHAWTQANELMGRENIRRAVRESGVKVHAMMFDAEQNQCIELSADSLSNHGSERSGGRNRR
jgi:carbonic anhydrase